MFGRFLTNRPRAGIYALLDGDRIMYVGQSRNVPKRIRQHQKAGKPFTAWRYLRHMPHSKAAKRRRLERQYIRQFNPPWNGGEPYERGDVWRARESMLRRHGQARLLVRVVAVVLFGAGLLSASIRLAALAVLVWIAGEIGIAGWRSLKKTTLGVSLDGPKQKRAGWNRTVATTGLAAVIVAVAVTAMVVTRDSKPDSIEGAGSGASETLDPDETAAPEKADALLAKARGRWALSGQAGQLELDFEARTVKIRSGGYSEEIPFRIVPAEDGELILRTTSSSGEDDVRIRIDGQKLTYIKDGVSLEFERIGESKVR